MRWKRRSLFGRVGVSQHPSTMCPVHARRPLPTAPMSTRSLWLRRMSDGCRRTVGRRKGDIPVDSTRLKDTGRLKLPFRSWPGCCWKENTSPSATRGPQHLRPLPGTRCTTSRPFPNRNPNLALNFLPKGIRFTIRSTIKMEIHILNNSCLIPDICLVLCFSHGSADQKWRDPRTRLPLRS